MYTYVICLPAYVQSCAITHTRTLTHTLIEIVFFYYAAMANKKISLKVMHNCIVGNLHKTSTLIPK